MGGGLVVQENIIKLLEKYENDIMQYTLGSSIDEYDKRYAEEYEYEWEEHKSSIAYTLDKLLNYFGGLSPIYMTYIIITEWGDIMTFDEGDLNIEGLEKTCRHILWELKDGE